jgi:Arc/MetJ-type ribon-helix-helix transcriptional regulator
MSEEQIGVRIPAELRAKIMENVGKGKPYRKITDFVLAAVEEKLNPDLRKARERDTFNEMIDEPEVLQKLRQNLGLN